MIIIIINDYYIINYYYLHQWLLFISMIANDCYSHRRLLATDDCHRLLRLPMIAIIIDECWPLLRPQRLLPPSTITIPSTITAPSTIANDCCLHRRLLPTSTIAIDCCPIYECWPLLRPKRLLPPSTIVGHCCALND